MLTHLAMATCMVILALTVRLEAFFALAVIAGIQRACFYAVPYSVTNDILQSMVSLVTGIMRT